MEVAAAQGGGMGGGQSPAESPLPPAILRSLGDRSYDKRKNAALEIEALIKALHENDDTDRICSVVAMLGQVGSDRREERSTDLIGGGGLGSARLRKVRVKW